MRALPNTCPNVCLGSFVGQIERMLADIKVKIALKNKKPNRSSTEKIWESCP